MWYAPFLLLDGLMLYGAIGVFSLLALVSMEYEKPGICTVIVIIALGVLEYYSSLHPLTFAYHNPIDAAVLVALYFCVGTGWIIVKWFSHVYKVRDRFNEVKQDCIKNVREMPDQYSGRTTTKTKADFVNTDGSLTAEGMRLVYDQAAMRIGERHLPLLASEHKGEMYMWWLLWPLSLGWTLLSDPITRLWHFVYNLFGGVMQRISDHAFRLN
jgi:hypothetical protein